MNLKIEKCIAFNICIALFLVFLDYSGAFRDYSNPIEVTAFYFDCLKNREGFLTYSISKPKFFNKDYNGALFRKYKMNAIKKIEYALLRSSDEIARVETKILYKKMEPMYVVTELEKSGNIWLIKDMHQ
ncbi:hypothetical protein ACFL2Y_02530 [Candidatus Omnitrophota bacterium]